MNPKITNLKKYVVVRKVGFEPTVYHSTCS